MKRILSFVLCMVMLAGMMSSMVITSSAVVTWVDTMSVGGKCFSISAGDGGAYTHLGNGVYKDVNDENEVILSFACYFGTTKGGSNTSRLMIGSEAGIQLGYDFQNKRFFIGKGQNLFGGNLDYSNLTYVDFEVPTWKGDDSAYNGYGDGWVVLGFKFNKSGAAIQMNGMDIISTTYSALGLTNNKTGNDYIIFYPHNIIVYIDNITLYVNGALKYSNNEFTSGASDYFPLTAGANENGSPSGDCKFHLWQAAVTAVHRYGNNDITYTTGCGHMIGTLLNYYNNGMTAAQQSAAAANGHKLVIDEANTYYNAIKNAVDKINAIGTVAYNSTSKSKIDAARTAYNNCPSNIRDKITNYSTLTKAETRYNELKAAADNQAAADAVIAKIKAIGTVTYTDASKELIDAARAAYDALNSTRQGMVGNYSTLTAAETKYAELKAAAEKEAADKAAAQAAVDKINAIGNVVYTDQCKSKIDAARSAYNALTDAQKALVPAAKKTVLEGAESTYKTLADEVTAFKNAVSALPQPATATDACANAITSADNAYAVLTDAGQIAAVATEKANLDAYKVAYKTAVDNKTAADAVISKIEAIGPVSYTQLCKNMIDAARAAYDTLTDTQKALVTNYSDLTDAEATYAALEKAANDKAAADEVIALINAIGDVTLDDADAIAAARAAFKALTADQQALVSNIATLETAEARLAELQTAKAQADAVVAKINAIGDVTLDSKAAIEDAEAAYAALSQDAKDFVTNYATLTAARKSYDARVLSTVKQFNTDAKAELEDQTIANKTDIINLINYYNSTISGLLNHSQFNGAQINSKVQAQNNAKDLEEALTAIEALEAGVADVEALIDAIGEVTLSSGDAIVAAENAYAALNDEQKALVSNYATLTAARATYDALVAADNKAKADAEAFAAIVDAIDVVYTDDCLAAINAAYTAYANLSDAAEAYAADAYAALEAKKAQYTALDNGVKAVQNAAASLGTLADDNYDDNKDSVTYTAEYLTKITAAEATLVGLTDEQIAVLTAEISKIEKAREYYDALDAEVQAFLNAYNKLPAEPSATEACKNAIVPVAIAYATIHDAGQKAVLADEIDAYLAFRAKWVELSEAAVINAANALGNIPNDVTYTAEYLAKIETAEAAVASLGTNSITKLSAEINKIEAARAKYDEYDAEVIAYKNAVAALPDAPSTTDECRKAIAVAATAYATLTAPGQVQAVEAEKAIYDAFRTGWLQLLAAEFAAEVDAIVVDLNALNAINAAYGSYEALHNEAKPYAADALAALDAKKSEYDALVVADNAAREAAKAFDDAVDAIGTVTLDSEKAITDARAAYEALAVKKYATKLDVLEAAEDRLAVLKAAKAVADEFNSDVADFGEVTLNSGAAIAALEERLAGFNADVLSYVTTADALAAIRAEYDALVAADNAAKAAAKAFDDAVEAIVVDLNAGAAIDDAYAAYEVLAVKEYATKKALLDEKKAEYDALVAYKNAQDAASAVNKVKATSLVISDSLAVNYKIVVDKAYTIVGMEFKLAGKTVLVTDYTTEGEKLVFRFNNIAPNLLAETIYSVIIVKDADGNEIECYAQTYSITTYANKKIATEGLTELLASMINYGDAAVAYTGEYTVPSSVITNWTNYESAIVPVREYTSIRDITTDIADPAVTFGSANLILTDSVDICIKLSGEIGDGYKAIGVYNGKNYEFDIVNSAVVWNIFNAAQMSNACAIEFTIYDAAGNAVSNTLTYSVESYVASMLGKDEKLDNLLTAMMQYGDAALAYKHANG